MFITRVQYDSSFDPVAIKDYYDTIVEESGEEAASMFTATMTPTTLCTYGYVFFDYKRALYNDTNIASLMDIDNVISHFGEDFIKSQLLFDSAVLNRYSANPDSTSDSAISAWDTFCTIETYFGGSAYYPDTSYTPAPISSWHTNVQEMEGYAHAQVEYGLSGEAEYSRFIPRFGTGSIAMVEGTSGTEDYSWTLETDYAISMFEFYDYQDLDSVVGDEWYKFDITLQDHTLNAVNAISSSYAAMMTGSLTEYRDMAHTDCYYNNIEGTFNRFFIDGVTNLFPDSVQAPWVRAPIIYHIHKDILTNEFEGNVEEIIEISQEITDKISPETGTLEQLEAFYRNFEALWDYFYAGPGSTIYDLVYNSDGDVLLDSPQELLYCNIAENLPDMQVFSDIFYLNETPRATIYIMDEWSSTAEFESRPSLTQEEAESRLIELAKKLNYISSWSGGEKLTYADGSEYLSELYDWFSTTAFSSLIARGNAKAWSAYQEWVQDQMDLVTYAEDISIELKYRDGRSETTPRDTTASEINDWLQEFAMLCWPASVQRGDGSSDDTDANPSGRVGLINIKQTLESDSDTGI